MNPSPDTNDHAQAHAEAQQKTSAERRSPFAGTDEPGDEVHEEVLQGFLEAVRAKRRQEDEFFRRELARAVAEVSAREAKNGY